MTQPVGVLALRIWRNKDGEIRARITSRLDALDPGDPEVSYQSSTAAVEASVTSWVRRYDALTDRSGNRRV